MSSITPFNRTSQQSSLQQPTVMMTAVNQIQQNSIMTKPTSNNINNNSSISSISNNNNTNEIKYILPFLPEHICYLCRSEKVEESIVKAYFGHSRAGKFVLIHLSCSMFFTQLSLLFSAKTGLEVFNLASVSPMQSRCSICSESENLRRGYSINCLGSTTTATSTTSTSCRFYVHLSCISSNIENIKLREDQSVLKFQIACQNHISHSMKIFSYATMQAFVDQSLKIYSHLQQFPLPPRSTSAITLNRSLVPQREVKMVNTNDEEQIQSQKNQFQLEKTQAAQAAAVAAAATAAANAAVDSSFVKVEDSAMQQSDQQPSAANTGEIQRKRGRPKKSKNDENNKTMQIEETTDQQQQQQQQPPQPAKKMFIEVNDRVLARRVLVHNFNPSRVTAYSELFGDSYRNQSMHANVLNTSLNSTNKNSSIFDAADESQPVLVAKHSKGSVSQSQVAAAAGSLDKGNAQTNSSSAVGSSAGTATGAGAGSQSNKQDGGQQQSQGQSQSNSTENDYLVSKYPNSSNEKDMQEWWQLIDQEYFTVPEKPLELIQDILRIADPTESYEVIATESTRNQRKSENGQEQNNSMLKAVQILKSKRISSLDLEMFVNSTLASLFLKDQELAEKELEFGYRILEQEKLSAYQRKLQKAQLVKTQLLEAQKKQEIEAAQRIEDVKKEEGEAIQSEVRTELQEKQEDVLVGETGRDTMIVESNGIEIEKEKREIAPFEPEILNGDENSKNQGEQDEIKNEEIINDVLDLDEKDNDDEEKKEKQENLKENEPNKEVDLELEHGVEERVEKVDSNLKPEKIEEEGIEEQEAEEMEEEEEEEDEEEKQKEDEDLEDDKVNEDQSVMRNEEDEEDGSCLMKGEKEGNVSKSQKKGFSMGSKKFKNARLRRFEDKKRKQIHYYQREYHDETMPVKLESKLSVMFHAVNGESFLVLYEVNEKEEKRKLNIGKQNSEYVVCNTWNGQSKPGRSSSASVSVSKDAIDGTRALISKSQQQQNDINSGLEKFAKSLSQKQSMQEEFFSNSMEHQPHHNHPSGKRWAIPTMETAPQLAFSAIMRLDDASVVRAIHEQIEINTNIQPQKPTKDFDRLGLASVVFEKQWCEQQSGFTEWQLNSFTQIQKDLEVQTLKTDSIRIWNRYKLSQAHKNLTHGFSFRKEYNTEIYFFGNQSEDDNQDNDGDEEDEDNAVEEGDGITAGTASSTQRKKHGKGGSSNSNNGNNNSAGNNGKNGNRNHQNNRNRMTRNANTTNNNNSNNNNKNTHVHATRKNSNSIMVGNTSTTTIGSSRQNQQPLKRPAGGAMSTRNKSQALLEEKKEKEILEKAAESLAVNTVVVVVPESLDKQDEMKVEIPILLKIEEEREVKELNEENQKKESETLMSPSKDQRSSSIPSLQEHSVSISTSAPAATPVPATPMPTRISTRSALAAAASISNSATSTSKNTTTTTTTLLHSIESAVSKLKKISNQQQQSAQNAQSQTNQPTEQSSTNKSEIPKPNLLPTMQLRNKHNSNNNTLNNSAQSASSLVISETTQVSPSTTTPNNASTPTTTSGTTISPFEDQKSRLRSRKPTEKSNDLLQSVQLSKQNSLKSQQSTPLTSNSTITTAATAITTAAITTTTTSSSNPQTTQALSTSSQQQQQQQQQQSSTTASSSTSKAQVTSALSSLNLPGTPSSSNPAVLPPVPPPVAAVQSSSKQSTVFMDIPTGKYNPTPKRMRQHNNNNNTSTSQQQGIMKDQLETDCMVCFSQQNCENNQVVYCSVCQMSFHQICFGITIVPEGLYYCDKCSVIQGMKQKNRAMIDVRRFACPLCPETEIPIKLVYSKTRDNRNEEGMAAMYDQKLLPPRHQLNDNEELWMHPFCMFAFDLARFYEGRIYFQLQNYHDASDASKAKHKQQSQVVGYNSEQIQTSANVDSLEKSNNDILVVAGSDVQNTGEELVNWTLAFNPKNYQIKQQWKFDKEIMQGIPTGAATAQVICGSNSGKTKKNTQVVCQICEQKKGLMVKCIHESCGEYFHPLCAFFCGLDCAMKEHMRESAMEMVQGINIAAPQLAVRVQCMRHFEVPGIKCCVKEETDNNVTCQSEKPEKNIEEIKSTCEAIEVEEIHDSNEGTESKEELAKKQQIKELQSQTKLVVEYYLKQIFFRRFGVNYENICSRYLYYSTFEEEILKNPTQSRLKFFHPVRKNYCSIADILKFIDGVEAVVVVEEEAEIALSKQVSQMKSSIREDGIVLAVGGGVALSAGGIEEEELVIGDLIQEDQQGLTDLVNPEEQHACDYSEDNSDSDIFLRFAATLKPTVNKKKQTKINDKKAKFYRTKSSANSHHVSQFK